MKKENFDLEREELINIVKTAIREQEKESEIEYKKSEYWFHRAIKHLSLSIKYMFVYLPLVLLLCTFIFKETNVQGVNPDLLFITMLPVIKLWIWVIGISATYYLISSGISFIIPYLNLIIELIYKEINKKWQKIKKKKK